MTSVVGLALKVVGQQFVPAQKTALLQPGIQQDATQPFTDLVAQFAGELSAVESTVAGTAMASPISALLPSQPPAFVRGKERVIQRAPSPEPAEKDAAPAIMPVFILSGTGIKRTGILPPVRANRDPAREIPTPQNKDAAKPPVCAVEVNLPTPVAPRLQLSSCDPTASIDRAGGNKTETPSTPVVLQPPVILNVAIHLPDEPPDQPLPPDGPTLSKPAAAGSKENPVALPIAAKTSASAPAEFPKRQSPEGGKQDEKPEVRIPDRAPHSPEIETPRP